MRREPPEGWPQTFRNTACLHYHKCLDVAAWVDAKGLRCEGCRRFQKAGAWWDDAPTLQLAIAELLGCLRLITEVLRVPREDFSFRVRDGERGIAKKVDGKWLKCEGGAVGGGLQLLVALYFFS